MKKNLITILLMACGALGVQAHQVRPVPSLHVEGKWLVDNYGNHVVLHGVMDTPSAYFNGGRWGWSYDDAGRTRCINYFETLFGGLEQANCDVFRLHLDPAWTNDPNAHFMDASLQPLNDKGEISTGEDNVYHFSPSRLTSYLKTLYFPIAKRAINHGMFVVMRPPGVCPHDIKVGDYYQEYMLTVWDIVTKNDSIRKYSGQISLELANEPVNVKNANGASDKKALRDFFQPVVDKIRANGFKGIIWIPGSGWQSGYADYKTYPIVDSNFGYAVHDYNGWYGCEDKNISPSNVTQATKNKITQFHNQVPVVDTNPIIVTEIDWSPTKEGTGHYNEHGQWVESNWGTWATGRTSAWGIVTKGVHDHYGNISMTLSGTACLIDIDKLINNKKVEPAFDGIEEACGKACFDWYAEYAKVDNPSPDYHSVPLTDLGNGKYQNPVVRADFPDPDVIRVGDTYYMVSTTMVNFPGATILKSKDMVNWEYCAQPLKKISDADKYNLKNNQNAYSKGMWACSMKYHDGKFYILNNCNEGGAYLLTATDPEGEWELKKLSRGYYDPGMLFDNGKVYVACGINNIQMCELDENFNFIQEKNVVSRDNAGLEGCHLYKKGDYYYIYATYGGWPSGQVVFRSENIFGPYEEREVLAKTINGQANTIHQGALVEDEKGNWWTIMQQDLGAFGRFPNLQPVKWNYNWPSVGNKGVPYETYNKPAGTPDYPLKALPSTDDFRSYPLGSQWQWNHNPDDTGWSLFERPGWLRLKANSTTTSLKQARNMLTQRIFALKNKATVGTICLDVTRLQEGDVAGICIFQDPYAYIGVRVKDGKREIVWRQDVISSDAQPAEKVASGVTVGDVVYLRGSIKFGEDKTRFYYSLDNKTWKQLGSETQQNFNLSVFVGSRFGLFCYATKTTGGAADFDWFSTEENYDEAEWCPPFDAQMNEDMFTATDLKSAKTKMEAMVGGWNSPGLTVTYRDKHTENVSAQASYVADKSGIVEFRNGQMRGVSEGTTDVTASYVDPFDNKVQTTFNVTTSYFPFGSEFINTGIVGQGTYNEKSHAFKPAASGEMGWVYPDGVDMSGYTYLVVQLKKNGGQTQTADAHLNIYPTANVKGACYSTEKFGSELQHVINLSTAKYNSKTSKGKALDTKNIHVVSVWGNGSGIVLFDKVFLTNDTQYDPTGVAEVTALQSERVNVYSLSGQLVRHDVDRRQALEDLPAGFYIVGDRKVMVK